MNRRHRGAATWPHPTTRTVTRRAFAHIASAALLGALAAAQVLALIPGGLA